jgi:hypothetical protein
MAAPWFWRNERHANAYRLTATNQYPHAHANHSATLTDQRRAIADAYQSITDARALPITDV